MISTLKIKNMRTYLPQNGTQSTAWLLLLTFCFQLFQPVYAGGGGPTQPEVHGFTPVGASGMVDPFTGDFSYNIPLMDVEGYPINIAYSGGISMDQEASWVGLGWNLNVGSVVRNMRGLPDDFNGETVQQTTYMKPNRTISVDLSGNVEIFGKGVKTPEQKDTSGSFGINASLGINYNNYNGYSTEFSFGPSFSFAKATGHKLTAGFQLSGSSENGSSFAPSLSYQRKGDYFKMNDVKKTFTIGSALNSRAGLTDLSYGLSLRKYSTTAFHQEKERTGTGGISSSYDLGLHHYSPSSGPSMFGIAISGKLTGGTTAWGADFGGSVGISYSSQWIPNDQVTIEVPSYGYFFLENGQQNKKAQLDFNRDNDGSFTKYTPNLPSAFLTSDIFSIQAQGVSGSYRAFRNEVGYVFDPKVTTTNTSGSFGVEFGLGGITDIGFDASVSIVNSHTGGWDGVLNKAADDLLFQPAATGLETYALKDASEGSVDNDLLMSNMGGITPKYFPLNGFLKFVSAQDKLSGGGTISIPDNSRTTRYKRNAVMQFLTHKELSQGFGTDAIHPEIHDGAKDHHIGEITHLGTDGRRYVFGIAAYNHTQEDATFATGVKSNGDAGIPVTDAYNGLISYDNQSPEQTVSVDNDFGIDNYYNSSTTPAYAHSYLLTAVLGDDYVDSDTEKGPSKDDLGAYVKISYDKVDDYKWRSPIPRYSAYRNEGLKVDVKDDKASFVYGEKDLWYVKAVETKNFVAVFTLEDRFDGAGAVDRHGGIDGSKRMKKLVKITLYSKPDYDLNELNATPIKTVNFVYDYSRCQGYPANTNTVDGQKGKLTLKEVYFTYQESGKMRKKSYSFEYDDLNNPVYNLKAVDRWGNYKATSSGLESTLSTPMNNADFPYTEQDEALAKANVSAWSLKAINLPTGGRIEVEYESDDYAYVQDKRAMQMFPIVGTTNSIANNASITDYGVHSVSQGSTAAQRNQAIYFKMKPGHDNINDYVNAGQFLYFRCLVDFREDEGNSSTSKYDYVSGYGIVGAVSAVDHNGTLLGKIDFVGEKIRDNGPSEYNPISKFALQFARMHLSSYAIGTSPDEPDASNASSFGNSILNAFSSYEELFDGPNKPIWEKERGREIVTNKSWIRLVDPARKKLGGGHRVKRIKVYDKWNSMTGGQEDDFDYGQEYTYELEDGTSSGVASYEPQIGGDENPWHQPIPYSNKIRWGTDDKLYVEEPLMESQFPSPVVGYSRVVITDLKRDGVTRTATGKIVKEFYTAKDFPTVVTATDVDLKTSNSFLPILPKYQYVTASQGYTIELNDMHGKPRKESVYAEGSNHPLSFVEYLYQTDANGKLTNDVLTVNAAGQSSVQQIGVKYEAVADFRESSTLSSGVTMQINTNSFLFGFLPIVVPSLWPSVDIADNQFHSATLTKVVNRSGILYRVVADQDGSRVETANLAYDAETGEVLATQTTTNFNDNVYSMNYPAYWHYDQLGQAYKNIGYRFGNGVNFSNSGYASVPSASSYFVEGDELAVTGAFPAVRGWVTNVSPTGITVVNKAGLPLTVQSAALKVIRSGRRNKQSVSMAGLGSLSNPINYLTSNAYPNVLSAGAVEFGQGWKTYCDCFKDGSGNETTINPYILGTRGNWRPVKSYTHLSGRTLSNYDGNTNIRKDGVFTSYTPYYKLSAGTWTQDPANWTFVSEVTAFSPNGMGLETRDALGRYSGSLYGYNNTLPTAVAVNSRSTQMASLHFEDVDYTNCMDQQLEADNAITVEKQDAHTGRNSLRVQSGTPVVYTVGAPDCEETPCTLSIMPLSGGLFEIVNGQTPYTMSTTVVTGSVDGMLNAKLITLEGDTSSYYEIILTVTDGNGCQVTQTFNNN